MEIANSATDKTEMDFAQMLHDKPEQVFASYKSRTAKEILVMADAWKEKKAFEASISPEGLLQTFLYHLDGKTVPGAVKPPVENDLSDRAWASLQGLDRGFSTEFSSNPKLRAELISAWPSVFKWCRYLYDQRVASEKDSEIAKEAINPLCNAIRGLYLDPELQAIIRATPGIVTLCARLCLHSASPASAFILLSLLHANTWDGMDEIVAAAGGKPDAVAKQLLDRLRLAISQSPIHPDVTFTLTFILSTFMSVPRHPLSFAILADNSVWIVARMLFLVSEAIGSSPDRRADFLGCIQIGVTLLRTAMVQDGTPRLVSQAVDAGLLRAICALSRILDDLEQSKPSQDDLKPLKLSLRFILGDILPKSMMYRSVIKVMKDEHKELDPDVADRTIMRSYLREEWMSLVLLLYLRITIAKFPKQIRGKGNVSCDCVTCGKRGQKSELLRCSGCLYVYYCSKKCQKEAWPIHRDMCKLKKSSKAEGGSPMFSEQDTQFLREVVGTDAHIHYTHLQKLAKRKFPKEPVENFIICIDYTNPKYPAGTCSLKNIKTYVFPPVSSEAVNPANVEAQNAEMIKMVRLNPREYTFVEATFAYGQQRLTRNLMMRPNRWVHPPEQELSSALNWQNNKCENQDGPAEGLLEFFLAVTTQFADL